MPTTKKNSVGRKRKQTVEESDTATTEKIVKKDVKSKVTGHILTIGQGDVGQLGLGDEILERKRPAPINEVEGINFIQVTCGGMHSVAVTDKGEVYTWGCNDDGALGRPTNGEDGEEYLPRKVKFPDNVKIVSVSAGDSHTAALTDDGLVYAWGAYRDASGQIGLTSASLGKKNEIIKAFPKSGDDNSDPVIKIESGNDHTVILTKKGYIYTSGSGEQGQLGRIKECFGNRGGRRGLDFLLLPQIVRFRKKHKFSDIFAGSFSTFALSCDTNEVYAWGLNNYGQLGSGTTVNYFNPEIIKPLTEIREKAPSRFQIHSGQHHSLLVDGNGTAYCIGRAEYGRLGLGEDAQETSNPMEIFKLADQKVKLIACGEAVSFAITEEGHVYSWGLGTSLQLGVGDEDDMLVPTLIKSKCVNPNEDEVLSASAGGQHTALLVRKRVVDETKDES